MKVVVFGSHARGTYTVGSDVDLLVIQRLEPYLYTEAEYETARATVDRMVRVGIPLVG